MGSGLTALQSCTSDADWVFRLIHTGGIHSSFGAEIKTTGPGSFPSFDAFRQTIRNLRQEADACLLVDTGDFTGSTYFHKLFRGVPECAVINRLGYDAITLGDSDLSSGLNSWIPCRDSANFELICSNYDLNLTALGSWSKPFKVYTRGDLRVGVYALGPDLKGRVSDRRREELVFSPPTESALYWEKRLREDEDCDLIICLSQLGFDHSDRFRNNDLRLSSKLLHTDVIVGGHPLRAPEEPIVTTNEFKHRVVLSYSDPYARSLGVVDFRYARAEGVLRRPVRWTMKSV